MDGHEGFVDIVTGYIEVMYFSFSICPSGKLAIILKFSQHEAWPCLKQISLLVPLLVTLSVPHIIQQIEIFTVSSNVVLPSQLSESFSYRCTPPHLSLS